MAVWVYDPFCSIWVSSHPREVINETRGTYVCQKDVLPLLRSMLEVKSWAVLKDMVVWETR